MTPITLLILCGILAFGVYWGYQQVTAPLPGNAPTPCATTNATELTSNQVVVRVLNGGYVTGLGGKVSKELQGYGFTVSGTGNTQERVKKTVIAASSLTAPEALLVQGFFKDSEIRVDPDRVIDHRVDVIVGSEYGGIEAKAPQKVAVTGGTVCLAVQASPTVSASPGANASAAVSPQPSASP